MTARQPRRARRRAAPASNLPRPQAETLTEGDEPTGEQARPASSSTRSPRRQFRHREHHVSKDYSYVHRDLLTVLVIGIIAVAFIIGMSFVVS